jgi:hypothetical protein
MSGPRIRQVWASLDAPLDGALRFSTAPLAQNSTLLLGRSAEGPALLVPLPEPRIGDIPIELRNLSVRSNLSCRVRTNGVEHEGLFTVCMCTSSDANLHGLFLEAVDVIVGQASLISANAIHDVIAGLVELFRALSMAPETSILGLWGELFLVLQSAEPETLVSAWHQVPNDRFDFAKATERLEVKTAARTRKHHFHLPQLETPDVDVLVASVVTESSAAGATVQDLVQAIVAKAGPQVSGSLMHAVAAALGRDLPGWTAMRYDLSMAHRSLKYFAAGSIPRPQVSDRRVSDVRFLADLSDLDAVEPPAGPLFSALVG